MPGQKVGVKVILAKVSRSRIELLTSCVLDRRDNHYTSETQDPHIFNVGVSSVKIV
jgi:hypothetical protein